MKTSSFLVINKFDEVLKHIFVVSDISAYVVWTFEFKLKIRYRSLAPKNFKLKATLLQVNISRPRSGLFFFRWCGGTYYL